MNRAELEWEDDDDDDDTDSVNTPTTPARRQKDPNRGRDTLDDIESLEQEFAADLHNLQSEFLDMSSSNNHHDAVALEFSQRDYDQSDDDASQEGNPFLGAAGSTHSMNTMEFAEHLNNSTTNGGKGNHNNFGSTVFGRSAQEVEDSEFWEDADPSLANLNDSFTLNNSNSDALLDDSTSDHSHDPLPPPGAARHSTRRQHSPPRPPRASHTSNGYHPSNNVNLSNDSMGGNDGPHFNLVDVSHRDATDSEALDGSQWDDERNISQSFAHDDDDEGPDPDTTPRRKHSLRHSQPQQQQQRKSSLRQQQDNRHPQRRSRRTSQVNPVQQQQDHPHRRSSNRHSHRHHHEEDHDVQDGWEQEEEDASFVSEEEDSSDSETISSHRDYDDDHYDDPDGDGHVDWLDESNRGKYATSSRGLLGNSSRMSNSGGSRTQRRAGGRRRSSGHPNTAVNASSRRHPMNESGRRQSRRASDQLFAAGGEMSGSTKDTAHTDCDDPLLIVDKTPDLVPQQDSDEFYHEEGRGGGHPQQEGLFVDDRGGGGGGGARNSSNPNRPNSSSNKRRRSSIATIASIMDWNAWWIGMIALCCCCLILILVIVLPIYFLVIKDNNNNDDKSQLPPATPPPTGYIIPLTVNSMETIEQNLLSPQARAYDWLLQDPNLDSYDDHRKTQRFALATLFYSFRGENWTSASNDHNWLDYEADECAWGVRGGGSDDGDSGGGGGGFHTRCEDVNAPLRDGEEAAATSNRNIFHHGDNNKEALSEEVGSQRKQLRRHMQTQLGANLVPKLAIVTINLPNNNLVGSMPAEIELLSDLRSMNLGNNTIFSNLPVEIEGMRNLVSLNITNNLVSGGIPWISSPLQVIDVSHNQFSVPIPTWLVSLTTLEVLDLSYNKFAGSFPESTLAWGKSLKTIRLHYNQLRGQLPNEIGFLSNLEVFEADHNKIVGTLPTQLGAMLMLQEVVLYNNDLSGPIPSEIGRLKDLQRFEMVGNRLTGRLPPQMALLTKLETLWLYDNELTGPIPPEMGYLEALRHFILYDNKFTGTLPDGLCGIDELQFDCPSLCGCNCTCPLVVEDSIDESTGTTNSTDENENGAQEEPTNNDNNNNNNNATDDGSSSDGTEDEVNVTTTMTTAPTAEAPAGNPCEGSMKDLPPIPCTDEDGVATAGEQSPVNVTRGYNGLLNTTASPISNFTLDGLCPVGVNWKLGAEHYSLGFYDENGVGPDSSSESTVGYQCYHYNASDPSFTTEYEWEHCENMRVGQTYEIQWPHSQEGACGTDYQYQSPFGDGMYCNFSENAAEIEGFSIPAQLVGIQAQVFTVVNDEDFYYPDLLGGMIVVGEWGTDLAMYTGSTTTTSATGNSSSAVAYDNTDNCSPLNPITWHVDRVCHLISASSFDKLCADLKAQADEDLSGDVSPQAPRDLVLDILAANNHVG